MLAELLNIGNATWIILGVALALIIIGSLIGWFDWLIMVILMVVFSIVIVAFAQPAYDALFVVSPQEKLEREVEQAKKNAELAVLQAQVNATIEALNNPPQTTPEPTVAVQPTTPSNVEPQGNDEGSGNEIDNGEDGEGTPAIYQLITGDILGETKMCRYLVSGPNQTLPDFTPRGVTSGVQTFTATAATYEEMLNERLAVANNGGSCYPVPAGVELPS